MHCVSHKVQLNQPPVTDVEKSREKYILLSVSRTILLIKPSEGGIKLQAIN